MGLSTHKLGEIRNGELSCCSNDPAVDRFAGGCLGPFLLRPFDFFWMSN
jgi:hypothetical protein